MKTSINAPFDLSTQERSSWVEATRQLFRQFPTIMYSGATMLVLFVITLFLIQIDERTVLGINTWIKPAKFLLSGGVYLMSMAWVFSQLADWNEKRSQRMSVFMAWLLNFEIGLIVMQGARGIASHFNRNTQFDAIVWILMGVLILFNTFILFRMLWLSWAKPLKTTKPLLWAIRLGLLLLILSGFEGGYVAQNASHTVGGADGGAGIFFLNWSTEGGDLRIAHFFGMHGIQLFALLAFFLQSRTPKASQWVVGTAIVYAFLCLGTFVHAMMGYPLF